MRWAALVCWLGAATTLSPCAFLEDQRSAEYDRILRLMNDEFMSAPASEEFNAPNATNETVPAAAKEPPYPPPDRVHGGIQ